MSDWADEKARTWLNEHAPMHVGENAKLAAAFRDVAAEAKAEERRDVVYWLRCCPDLKCLDHSRADAIDDGKHEGSAGRRK
jgi:hypothetical protein